MFWEGCVFASLSHCRDRGTCRWRMGDACWCPGQFLTLTRQRYLHSPTPHPQCALACGSHGEDVPFFLILAIVTCAWGAKGSPNLNPTMVYTIAVPSPFVGWAWECGKWSQPPLWILDSAYLTEMDSPYVSELGTASIRSRLRRKKGTERTELNLEVVRCFQSFKKIWLTLC